MATQNTPTGIDLIQTAKNIWQKKGFILIIISISILLGLSTKLLKTEKKRYTATCTLLFLQSHELTPQYCTLQGAKTPTISQYVPTKSYPLIISSTPFIQKVLTDSIQINDKFIPIYTWINPKTKEAPNIRNKDSILQFSTIQQENINTLKKAISSEINEENGTFTINVTLKDPSIAAQIAQQIQKLFIKQIQSIENQQQEKHIQSIQHYNNELTQLIKDDTNTSQDLSQEQEKLYKFLTSKNNTFNSSFYILEPVILPTTPELQPSRSLLFFACLGLLLGIGLVLILPLIAEITESKYLSSWNSKKI